jgi:alpha-ribazole phosphatase
MEIYIIRHTKVAVGKEVCYGQFDVALADSFAEETKDYKVVLPADFDAVYCSKSSRCARLADALQLPEVHYKDDLMEMNFGDWENKLWNEIPEDRLNTWMENFVEVRAPNGENLLELHDRVVAFLDALRLKGYKKVLLITHAGVIRCIWAYFLKIPLHNIFKLPVGFGEIMICNLAKEALYDSIKQKG